MNMATINEAIQQLTISLQELTASSKEANPLSAPQAFTSSVELASLTRSPEVQSFLEKVSDYAERTRNVSLGTY
ncbi:MAG: hypothetical protein JWM99_5212 [Verrucomicrobiales bacterium]|nr:hypothetical protein [Verrucomicrobiales bacterium]